MVKKLTQLDLPCLPYPWTGESYDLSRAQTVLERLNDLLMMRTVQEEIEILSSETYIKKNGGTNNYQEPPQIRLIQASVEESNNFPRHLI
jgi:predicted choloylglycine hydrolase